MRYTVTLFPHWCNGGVGQVCAGCAKTPWLHHADLSEVSEVAHVRLAMFAFRVRLGQDWLRSVRVSVQFGCGTIESERILPWYQVGVNSSDFSVS